MRIAIALATFEGRRFVEAQLDSLLAQTRRPDEVVVSDDGSSDGTPEAVRAWAAAHPELPLRLLRNPGPPGLDGNFANAFRAARGDLVFPCDQDDVWFPEKLARMEAAMRADPECLVAVHDLEITDADLRPIGERKMSRSHAFGGPLRDYNVGMALAVRGPFLACCLEPPSGVSYDNWINACAHALGAKRLVEAPLAFYRRHGENAAQAEPMNLARRSRPFEMRLAYLRRVFGQGRGARDIDRQMRRDAELAAWLDAQSGSLLALGVAPQRIARLRAGIDGRRRFLDRRRAIRGRSKALRLLPALALAAEGGYRPFSGSRALLKDLLI